MNSWQVMCSPAWLVAWPNMWLCPLSSLRRALLVSSWRGPGTNENFPNLRLLGLSLTSFAYHAFFAECLPWPCVNRLQLCLAWSVLYSFMVHPLFHSRTTLLTPRTPLNPGRGVGAATSLAQDSVKTWVNCPCCWRVITPLIGRIYVIPLDGFPFWDAWPYHECHVLTMAPPCSEVPVITLQPDAAGYSQRCGGNGAALGGQRGSEELGHWGGYKKWRIWHGKWEKRTPTWVDFLGRDISECPTSWPTPFFFCNVFKLFYWKLAPRIDRNWEEWSRISALFLEEKPTKNGSAMVGNMHNHWESSGFSLCRTEGSTFVDRGELAKITANRWSFWGTCSREELKAPSSAMQLSSVPVKTVGP